MMRAVGREVAHDTPIDEIRHSEITNIQDRVVEAKKLNDEREGSLNRIRTAAICAPLVFVAAAVIATYALAPVDKTAMSTTKVNCAASSSSGVQGLRYTATTPR
jgi:hypothetical protein